MNTLVLIPEAVDKAVWQIAHWVADTVLCKEDSRKRAAIVKQFISVADVSLRIFYFAVMGLT
jgi:son of sevenless